MKYWITGIISSEGGISTSSSVLEQTEITDWEANSIMKMINEKNGLKLAEPSTDSIKFVIEESTEQELKSDTSDDRLDSKENLGRYYIDFYDAFDGWIGELTGILGAIASDELSTVSECCGKFQNTLDDSNIDCGEKFAVRDRIDDSLVYIPPRNKGEITQKDTEGLNESLQRTQIKYRSCWNEFKSMIKSAKDKGNVISCWATEDLYNVFEELEEKHTIKDTFHPYYGREEIDRLNDEINKSLDEMHEHIDKLYRYKNKLIEKENGSV